MLTANNMPAGAVVFVYVNDDGTETNFSVEHLHQVAREAILNKDRKIIWAPIDRSFATYCKQNRGIENHRLKRLSRDHREWPPVIFLEYPNGEHLLADGHHRYVRAAAMFYKTIRAIVLPERLWADCVVHGMTSVGTEALRTMYSGIE